MPWNIEFKQSKKGKRKNIRNLENLIYLKWNLNMEPFIKNLKSGKSKT